MKNIFIILFILQILFVFSTSKEAEKYYNQGNNFYKKMMYSKAIEFYLKSLELDEDYLEVYNALGSCYQQMQEWDKAIECFQKIINSQEKNFDYEKIYKNIGCVYLYKNDYENAILFLKKVLEINPSNLESYLNISRVFQKLENWEQSILNYQRVVELSPFSFEGKQAQETIAKIYLDLQMYEEAVFEYQIALDLNVNSFSCYLGLGKSALEIKKYELACNAFKQAIKLSKKDKEAYLGLLESYICLSDFKNALKKLKKIEKFVSSEELSEYKAYIYLKQEKYQEAIKEYLTIKNLTWQKHNNLGFCYLKIDQKEKAINEFKKSLELNPNQSDIIEIIKNNEFNKD